MIRPTPTTGAVKSPKDYRDIPLAAFGAATPLTGKFFVDVTKLPVWNQKKIGSCVGHAGAKYKQLLDWMETGEMKKLSPRFLYAIAKARDDYPFEGTFPRLVAKILKDHGCATEATVPNDSDLSHEAYVYNRVESDIPEDSWAEAKEFCIQGYAFPNVKSAAELGNAIQNYNGAMLLMRVGKEWWTKADGTSSWSAKDVVPLRPPKEIVSGHEVYLYGYEVETSGRVKFYIFNSWSLDWGMTGKAWFYHDEYAPFLDEAITFVDLPNNWQETIDQLPSKESFEHQFLVPIHYGTQNEEVKALQTALLIDGHFSRELYGTLLKAGSLGFYGSITAQAVLSFQRKHKVASETELTLLGGKSVGPKTRNQLNLMFG